MANSRFSEEQIQLLQKYGFKSNLTEPLSENDLGEIQDAAVEILQLHGIGDGDEVNDIGQVCEDIIDLTADNN